MMSGSKLVRRRSTVKQKCVGFSGGRISTFGRRFGSSGQSLSRHSLIIAGFQRAEFPILRDSAALADR
jgi:hypothetical protein